MKGEKMCEGPARGSVPVFQAEFQQLIGLNLQYCSYIKQQRQRKTSVHIGRFNSSHMLSTDPYGFRKLPTPVGSA